MAQNFTNNTLNAIQALSTDVFRARYWTPLFRDVPKTLIGLARQQTATVSPIIDANSSAGGCSGYEAHFMKLDSTVLPTIANTATTVPCTIGAGKAMTGNHADYGPDISSVTPYEYDTNKLCDTVFKNVEGGALAYLMRELTLAAGHTHTMALNGEVISRINTNKQVATYASSVGSITGGDVYISNLDLWKPKNLGSDLMPYLNDIAQGNGLPSNYLVIGGSDLAVALGVSGFIALNDNQRSENAVFNSFGDRLIIDESGMQAASLANSLFLVDPNAYGMYLHNEYGEQVENTLDANNTRTFSLPLQYVTNGRDGGREAVTLQYANGGVLNPARVDFRLQTNCNQGGGRFGRTSNLNNLQSIMEGAFLFAPNDSTGHTGIIKVTKGTP